MRRRTTATAGLLVAVTASAVAALSLMTGSAPSAGATTGASSVSIVNSGGVCTSVFCYEPSKLTVLPGTTVTWTDKSFAEHTVTRCNTSACSGTGPGTGTDPAFNSGVFGTTFSLVFRGVGTYNYYCQIHGFATMHGTVTVSSFFVSSTTLPKADVGSAYSTTLTARGGVTPYTWSVKAGPLPTGLKLSSTGKIIGTPTRSGTFSFTVGVTDTSKPPKSASKKLSIAVTT